MTRKQVAQRLGKSLATVRRIEGVLLHPTQDAKGVHRFDGDEVEALARNVGNGRVTLAKELRRSLGLAEPNHQCTGCAALQEQVENLRAQQQEVYSNHQDEMDALRFRHANEARAMVDQVTELLAVMER